ncbi:MAG: cyclopropane fatty acyl phospholipid synthase [Candidatus Uhrbacteria bacterium]|nr:cyclopropane fatty acyl phospholipid synthase [Candidatus Uhrbacteria bacterium]
MKAKSIISSLLRAAGITINGKNPWDIQIHNERSYRRVLTYGTLGIGESYMDGWWDSRALDETAYKFAKAGIEKRVAKNFFSFLRSLRSKIFNIQNKIGARKVAFHHYDFDNDLYMSFLDPYNQYTCGYFKETDNLGLAQEKKLDLICQKLQLKKSDRVLDIGCGWGGFAKWAAKHYGCHVTGVSISDEQIKFAREFTKGLPVEIIKSDYRDISGKYDKVLSIGMFEHVGYKNYKTYFEIVDRILKPNGLSLLHTIGRLDSVTINDPWFERYIFPNSMLPSIAQIGKAIDGLFVMEDWHNFGADYDKTLMAWWKNFDAAWPRFKQKYDEHFYRMFKYYLLTCAGMFRARDTQLWQIVLSKNGVAGGYRTIR